MKYRLMDFLICPNCKVGMEVHKIEASYNNFNIDTKTILCKNICAYKKGNPSLTDCKKCFNIEIVEGVLICQKCKKRYPIMGGIPRILSGESLKSLKKRKRMSEVAETYELGWKRYNKVLKEHRKEFDHVINPHLNKSSFKGRVILDAGCGQGRFSYFMMEDGAKEVISIDLSGAVEVAYKNLRGFPFAYVIQGDIYRLPLRKSFDIIFSSGVLHHLPNPRRGFLDLTKLLKSRSSIFIWVYGKSPIVRPLLICRKMTLKIPRDLMFYLAFFPALVLHSLNITYIIFNRIAFTKKMAKKIPLWQYAERDFGGKQYIMFDHLSVPIINFYSREELEDWFKDAHLKEFQITERYKGYSGSSWRGFGIK